jgi:hypothetical protein
MIQPSCLSNSLMNGIALHGVLIVLIRVHLKWSTDLAPWGLNYKIGLVKRALLRLARGRLFYLVLLSHSV